MDTLTTENITIFYYTTFLNHKTYLLPRFTANSFQEDLIVQAITKSNKIEDNLVDSKDIS